MAGTVSEVRDTAEERRVAGNFSVGLGRAGSLMFRDEITIFVDKSDPQPKCPNCATLRVIADVYGDRPTPVGVGIPFAVRLDVSEACRRPKPTDEGVELKRAIVRSPNSPRVSERFPVHMIGCDMSKSVVIELLKKELGAGGPATTVMRTVVASSFEVRASDLMGLAPYDTANASYPNLKATPRPRAGEDPQSKALKSVKARFLGAHGQGWAAVSGVEAGNCSYKWAAKALGMVTTMEMEAPELGVVVSFSDPEALRSFAQAANIFGSYMTVDDEKVMVCGEGPRSPRPQGRR